MWFRLRARPMFSSSVRVSSRLKSWNTKPSRSRRNRASSRGERAAMLSPSSRMSAALTVSMVEMQLSRVVFPLPDAPMIAINSPSSTSKLTRSSALVTLFLLP